MSYTVAQLLNMSSDSLDNLFRESLPGDIPNGEAQGTAILAPGTKYTAEIAEMVNHFAWQGKNFDAATGTLKNRILPLGLSAILAKVYRGESWLDKKDCIVLDYSRDVDACSLDSRRDPHHWAGNVFRRRLLGHNEAYSFCAAVLTPLTSFSRERNDS